ncbi:unnamed protein product [Schistosoma mattheei]|nr:unnamed protein product [Schistosoma mattheei]
MSSEEREKLKPVILQSQSTGKLAEMIKNRTVKVTAANVKTMKAKHSCMTRKQVVDMLRQNGEVREYYENRYVTDICSSTHEQI